MISPTKSVLVLLARRWLDDEDCINLGIFPLSFHFHFSIACHKATLAFLSRSLGLSLSAYSPHFFLSFLFPLPLHNKTRLEPLSIISQNSFPVSQSVFQFFFFVQQLSSLTALLFKRPWVLQELRPQVRQTRPWTAQREALYFADLSSSLLSICLL